MAPTSPVADWTIDDVSAFLIELSLDSLTDAFRKNAIDGKDLLELTDEDMMRDLECSRLQVMFFFNFTFLLLSIGHVCHWLFFLFLLLLLFFFFSFCLFLSLTSRVICDYVYVYVCVLPTAKEAGSLAVLSR